MAKSRYRGKNVLSRILYVTGVPKAKLNRNSVSDNCRNFNADKFVLVCIRRAFRFRYSFWLLKQWIRIHEGKTVQLRCSELSGLRMLIADCYL